MKQARFFIRFLILAGIIWALGISSGLSTTYALSGPGKNIMNCSRSNASSLEDGKLACYGIWDQGDEFGWDTNMCPNNENGDGIFAPKTGCVIKTNICKSGVATATAYHTPNKISDDQKINTIIENLWADANAVTSHVLRLWEYTCGKNVTPAEETGILSVFADGTLVMTGVDMSKSVALTQCKSKASSYPNSEIKCSWNNSQIYYVPKPETKATLLMYVDGKMVYSQTNLTRTRALWDCQIESGKYKSAEIRCNWNGEEIYYIQKPETKATLYVYINWVLNLTKENLTRESAGIECKSRLQQYQNSEVTCTWNNYTITYAEYIITIDGVSKNYTITKEEAIKNCAANSEKLPYKTIKCTWNGIQIWYYEAKEKVSTYVLYIDGKNYWAKYDVTYTQAKESCLNARNVYKNNDIECKWDNNTFYSSEGIDDEPEYCWYGYEYLLDIDRCIKSSSLTYYSLMKREFETTISRLSVSKLKIVLERIEDIEYRYSENTTTRLKLEALKIIIEKEIREQEGDDFDFSDLFD